MSPPIGISNFLFHKATHLNIPLSGTFELSPVCNFNCRMCYVRKSANEVAESERKILTLQQWIDIAKQARDSGMLYLLLTGGEPLLWPDFWELYEELIDMGFLISINTNGSLIDDKAVERFRRKPPHKINITLYGANDDTYYRLCGIRGVFDKVDSAIVNLQQAGIQLKINCSLTPENAEDLNWMVAYAKARNTVLSVSTYMLPPVRRNEKMVGKNNRFTPQDAANYLMKYLRMDRGEDSYNRYVQKILDGTADPPGLDEGCVDPVDGKVRCRAGRASFWITWDGWLLPCGMMPEPKQDVAEESFLHAWKQITLGTSSLKTSGICEKCPDRDVCHPCAAMAYTETGSSGGVPLYKCEMTREMFRIASKK